MTEEIKRILEYFKKDNCLVPFKTLYKDEVNDLLNYITNLQKENQSLKNNYNDNEQAIHKIMEENEKLKDTIKKDRHLLGCNFSKKDKYKQERDIYKQRNKKAVEYNKKIVEQYLKEDDCEYCDGKYNVAKKNLDILEGGDE